MKSNIYMLCAAAFLCLGSVHAQRLENKWKLPTGLYITLPDGTNDTVKNSTSYPCKKIGEYSPDQYLHLGLIGGGKEVSYQWYIYLPFSSIEADGYTPLEGRTGAVLNFYLSSAASYSLSFKCVAKGLSCTSHSSDGIDKDCTPVAAFYFTDIQIGSYFRIAKMYPNPAQETVHLELETEVNAQTPSTVTILDLNGNPVMTPVLIQGKQGEIQVSTLTKGQYILQTQQAGQKDSKRLYINK